MPPLPIDEVMRNSLTRRKFLRSSLGVVGAVSLSQLHCADGGGGEAGGGVSHVESEAAYEGIYTDRFTYRSNETIVVFGSLRSGAEVPFEFVRLDVQPNLRMAQVYATPNYFGRADPGARGAGFQAVFAMPASDLPPGVYLVRIPAESMAPENRINVGNGFPSDNSVAFFVVTPQVAGSSSRLLWVHDSLTGVAYGSFAGRSIYPTVDGGAHTVSYLRPGLDRGANIWRLSIPFLRNHGYEFEFTDLIDLAQAPPGFLDAYDLVCCVGQFEYMPNEVIDHLVDFQAGGGNVFAASNEFGIFRVRLDFKRHTLTTYKWDYATADPHYLTGDPADAWDVAGIGMTSPASAFETEVIGQTCWPAHRVSVAEMVSLPVYNLAEAGWILEGTGIGEGDALPDAFNEYASGLPLEFDGGRPRPILADEMRLPDGLVVWGARASNDGRDWRVHLGRSPGEWPSLSSGYATATLQQRASGSQVVTFPSLSMSEWYVGVGNAVYDRMLLNILARLTVRA